MATAKKLPSGSWRCLAYSHTEKVIDPKTGKWKDKRIYESFTSDDPSRAERKRQRPLRPSSSWIKKSGPRTTNTET